MTGASWRYRISGYAAYRARPADTPSLRTAVDRRPRSRANPEVLPAHECRKKCFGDFREALSIDSTIGPGRGWKVMIASPLQTVVRQMHLGLLWGACLLVPAWRRSEWSPEWRTELWYVLRGWRKQLLFAGIRTSPSACLLVLVAAFCRNFGNRPHLTSSGRRDVEDSGFCMADVGRGHGTVRL